jgi:hypothetical protein
MEGIEGEYERGRTREKESEGERFRDEVYDGGLSGPFENGSSILIELSQPSSFTSWPPFQYAVRLDGAVGILVLRTCRGVVLGNIITYQCWFQVVIHTTTTTTEYAW